MADQIDQANEYAEQQIRNSLANCKQYKGESASHCVECDAEIPLMRQRMLPGVQLCVACAEAQERRDAHLSK